MKDTISVAGINVTNTTFPSLLSDIDGELTQPTTNSQQLKTILTVNPEIVVQAHDSPKLKDILNSSWRTIPDGVGITLAGRIKGTPFRQRITGVELTKNLLTRAEEQKRTIGVIGGTEKTSKRFQTYLKTSFPDLSFWTLAGPWITSDRYESFSAELDTWLETNGKELRRRLDTTSILFVAMGAPKQEYFINHFKELLANSQKPIANSQQCIAVAVGGTFDELSGLVPEPPVIVNQLGLKWLFRFIVQPWRIRRQMRLVRFLPLILSS